MGNYRRAFQSKEELAAPLPFSVKKEKTPERIIASFEKDLRICAHVFSAFVDVIDAGGIPGKGKMRSGRVRGKRTVFATWENIIKCL